MPRAASLAAALQAAVPGAAVETLPGGKGDFRVASDGKVLWDKRGADGRFPEPAEVLARLGQKGTGAERPRR
ncbi:MAG: Rdx family protein [Planctomycetes bacterium]|nr:Rdx family protein [Planctomycetota bacterium]